MRASTSVATVAVVALVALAGCSGLPAAEGQRGPQPTVGEPDTAPSDLADPDEDALGWEGGYWYNESLPVTAGDGLNGTERAMVVNRSMARVERLRGVEFQSPVDVDVVSRETYREEYAGAGNTGETLRTFDDAKFEALFLVGEDSDAIDVQRSNRGSNVLGFYSSAQDRIVVVSPTKTPRIRETTLGHELVHALQFRQFGAGYASPTRDRANANSGLIEGDARFVDQQYGDRCGAAWDCVTDEAGGGGGGDLHLGVYVVKYFPYSDGPGFVEHVYDGNGSGAAGWDAVGDLYESPPVSSEQVAQPERYGEGEPSDPTLPDRSTADWQRVSVDGRAPYAEVGVGGLTAMLAYPAYDDSRDGAVLSPREFLNYEAGAVNAEDPFEYTTTPVEGWDGERMWVYEHDGDGDLAYTWRIAWDTPDDAEEFAATYRDLLRYWGGDRVRDAAGGDGAVWRIPEGESAFADAFRVTVDDDGVTVVNAPTVDELDAVHERR